MKAKVSLYVIDDLPDLQYSLKRVGQPLSESRPWMMFYALFAYTATSAN